MRAGEEVGFTHLGCVTWVLGVIIDSGGGVLTVGGCWGQQWVVNVGDRWRSLAMAVIHMAVSMWGCWLSSSVAAVDGLGVIIVGGGWVVVVERKPVMCQSQTTRFGE